MCIAVHHGIYIASDIFYALRGPTGEVTRLAWTSRARGEILARVFCDYAEPVGVIARLDRNPAGPSPTKPHHSPCARASCRPCYRSRLPWMRTRRRSPAARNRQGSIRPRLVRAMPCVRFSQGRRPMRNFWFVPKVWCIPENERYCRPAD
jgi:hypothetical protein